MMVGMMSNGNGGWFCVEDFLLLRCVCFLVWVCGFLAVGFLFSFCGHFLVCKIEGSGRLLVVF